MRVRIAGHQEANYVVPTPHFVCGLLGLMLAFSAAAQFNAAIQGTITDASGASVPAAKVTLTNTATSQLQATQTSAEGFYHFDGLTPGRYSLSVAAAGFKQETREDINVLAEQTQGVNMSLPLGSN